MVQALRTQLQRSAEHYTRREARAAQRAWSKTGQRPANFADAMEQTWADLPEAIRRELGPVVEGVVAALVALGGEGEALRDAAAGYVDEAIECHVDRSRDELAAGLGGGGMVSDIVDTHLSWVDWRQGPTRERPGQGTGEVSNRNRWMCRL